ALYEHEDPRRGMHQEWGTLVFNYGRNEVRNFLISNALFWFENYHLDGIRVDAVASMLYLDYNRESGEWLPNHYGGRENLEAVTFIRQLNRVLFEKFPGILSIAEESTAWAGVSHPTYTGGLGFNLKWNMGWMNDSLRYMEKDPVYRKYEHQLMTFSMMYAFSENFVLALSHDEVVHGKRSLLEKMPGDEWQKRANLRLYHAYLMGHPGKKLIFMGGEFGQWREWDEKVSLDWHLLENEGHRQLQHFCRELNRLYLRLPALYSNDFDWSGFRWIDHSDQDNSVLAFLRVPAVGYEGSEDLEHNGSNSAPVAFVFNFTPVPRRGYLLGLPEADAYHKIFDTDDPWFGGSGFSSQSRITVENHPSHGFPCRVSLDLPPLAALMLQPG
ncbi:MAG: 1,4-alpha-glucan branching enzyme, partial [SAR324 cluster bacterium]|nr:1,4-alpha-glucan branching enzyme [SAR324 cluster bacterium]